MKLQFFSFFIVAFVIISCDLHPEILNAKSDTSLISYVNTFIGTGGHGHTYPGATMPFGMMQLSPDTRLEGWDGCSGYHYSDAEIYGFSHTHLSGTGISDYGDILLMPTNKQVFNNGADGNEGYKSRFSHDKEVAEPGFYKVHLDDTNIDVELTVSKRSGMHRYNFPFSENQFVILDLVHRDKVLAAKIERISDTELAGFRFSEAWAKDQRLFFSIKTSHPFIDVLQSAPKEGMPGGQKIALKFINPNNEPIIIKIGISAVDIEGAKKNLEQEIGAKSFDETKKEAQETWEKQLNKIVLEDKNKDNKVNFYTSLYHTMNAPNLYQDVDGRYRGMDFKVHETTDFEYYTVFSLWDTYRAAHPLYTIIEQEKTNDFINTFLAKYDEGGIMPIWDLSANYTGCMIGYHAVSVIADAYLKGLRKYDIEKAFIAMKHSATRDKLGLDFYKKMQFIPVENESESVSKTLEYAYDDWAIAQMAKSLGKEDDYKTYSERAQYYKNVFDPSTQFMRGRFRNKWFAPFDPYEVNFNYTEANSWQYSFYVPQDISGFIKLMGGKEQLEHQLDKLFTATNKTSGSHQVDITGLIGQYAHGNEPSHHIAYLYNFVNKPFKTQEKIRQILTELYTNTPDGISGNEDCGQMSAWYVFSSLGFYPVTPGSNKYIIGSPLFNKATINLENGKSFIVQANNQSQENKYIESVKLNGENYEYSFINHQDIVNGGSLVFEMTNKPSNWGTADKNIPKISIEEHLIVAAPFIAKGEIAFRESTEVTLENADKEAAIFYRIGYNGGFKKFVKPFIIDKQIHLSVYSQKNETKSAIITTDFYKIDPNRTISLKTKYANQYNAGGKNALIDGIVGSADFRTGTWQGYSDTDLEAIVDLGSLKSLNEVSVGFLQDQRSWIFYPTEVLFLFSKDLKTFVNLEKESKKYTIIESDKVEIRNVKFNKINGTFRYIKIIAKNVGKLPEWHLGAKDEGRSWLFVDEIQVK
ncbi:GH92 family glycosyl hydrolase [Polaribacter glomeratus]|uniref:Glycosyl hydrolase family 92 n=1 Tax=Polaribacter glomeratus TaxID=102 RepID=A0A2S7WUT9_9FLAO|nr:GH92 family glycosyl hydrolase [Polaribacter glomeratus]PQJ81370.1 glycosyl hydrolase family 92 [Polaribacter glomeratus]TXD64832.1 glycoside hydrolase family 92 protein [Polaribacter glomeratus]